MTKYPYGPYDMVLFVQIGIGLNGDDILLLAHLSPSGTTRLALQTILLRLYSSPSFDRNVKPGAHWI